MPVTGYPEQSATQSYLCCTFKTCISHELTQRCSDFQNNSVAEMFVQLLNGTKGVAKGVTPEFEKKPEQKNQSQTSNKNQ